MPFDREMSRSMWFCCKVLPETSYREFRPFSGGTIEQRLNEGSLGDNVVPTDPLSPALFSSSGRLNIRVKSGHKGQKASLDLLNSAESGSFRTSAPNSWHAETQSSMEKGRFADYIWPQ
jgi:hypothetical protein